LRIRRYRSPDGSAVIALFREFMQEFTQPGLAAQFQAYVDRAVREELGRIEDYYLSRSDQNFWVAETDAVVGMVGIERHGSDSAELRRMAVRAARRRQGIGRALLATAEAFCRERGYRTLVLSTSELQVPAMRLYEASGFRLERKETAVPASHKSVGAGIARYHYGKSLA
jgi:ribosomal protein S18 acetylase RimI-like enzyme